MTEPLITKYRPFDWDEMIGHETIIAALKRAIEADTRPHAYLMTGPSGTGKTTSARIIARHLGCDDVLEIDAASNNGIDTMRELVELGNHRSLNGSGSRAFILDECHALSKSAWQAILKLIEEPPAHLYLMLCTTELPKVPETIKQRCYHVALKSLKPDEIFEFLEMICEAEEWKVSNDVMSAVVQAAGGSPRKALSMLQAVYGVETREEVNRIIALNDASEPMIELCQLVLRAGNPTWTLMQPIIARIEEDDFEEGLIGAGRYVAAALMRTKSETEAKKAWAFLDAITFPTTTYDKKIHFLAAIGRLVFA